MSSSRQAGQRGLAPWGDEPLERRRGKVPAPQRWMLAAVGEYSVRLAPALVILAVVALELLTGSRATVLSLVVIAPLLAASGSSPGVTGSYASGALGVGAGLGLYGDQYTHGRLSDQLVRLSTIGVGGLLAVISSRARTRREARLARVLRVAAVAQQAILPPVPAQLGQLRLAASYDSATEDAQVGGDAYAVEATPFGVRLLVADVRGHGLEAVRQSASLLGSFRERAHDRPGLQRLAADLDRAVLRGGQDEDFATALLLQVSGDRLTLVNAGHPAPLLVREGRVTALEPAAPSPPLGLGADSCPVLTLDLRPRDRVLLYTDGAAEARRATDDCFFSVESQTLVCLAERSPTEAVSLLRQELLQWTGGRLQDDVTFVVVEVCEHLDEQLPPAPPRVKFEPEAGGVRVLGVGIDTSSSD